MIPTHQTAPTQFVEANGIRFAYRRFGKPGGMPLVFMQHFRGGMDHWDPAVTDGFAEHRPVIRFDNAGVAASIGETPDTINAMADQAADFIGALGLAQVDLLGFSIGGYIAQTLALRRPELIRRLILAGTGPRAGEPPEDPEIRRVRRLDRFGDRAKSRSRRFFICSSARPERAKPPQGPSGRDGMCERMT